MTTTATIIEDSISAVGSSPRLTTFQLRYPRFIHAELMTHRVFSRNASSSRAIPVARMIEELQRDPAMPIFWGSNKPGMQAGDELSGKDLASCKEDWLIARDWCIERAEWMVHKGLHKQIANRILEPWAHINVVVTATDFANFYMLRRHTDAQPEIKLLADLMWEAQQASIPKVLMPGEWHLPFVDQSLDGKDVQAAKDQITCNGVMRVVPMPDQILDVLKQVSTARCARVSYLTHDGRRTTVAEDKDLHDKLMVGQPLHASPAEHQGTPDRTSDYGRILYEGDKETVMDDPANSWDQPELHGNFTGWIQYRKTLEGEFLPG